jgi:hypothetical protein
MSGAVALDVGKRFVSVESSPFGPLAIRHISPLAAALGQMDTKLTHDNDRHGTADGDLRRTGLV